MNEQQKRRRQFARHAGRVLDVDGGSDDAFNPEQVVAVAIAELRSLP